MSASSLAVTEEESDISKWERAYDLVVLQGKSYLAASRELGCSHPTAKAWAEKYREILQVARTQDKEAQRVELESQIVKAIQQSDDVYTRNNGKGLTQVGAINSKKSLLELLMRVRGLEAPKESKAQVEGTLVIEWGTQTQEIEVDHNVIDVEG